MKVFIQEFILSHKKDFEVSDKKHWMNFITESTNETQSKVHNL